VVFSPNGKYLALAVIQLPATDQTPRPGFACVWDTAARGKPIRFERGKLPARSVAFSSDSMLLALGLSVAGSDLGSVVEMWNVTTGAHSTQIDAPLAVSGPHVAFARTGPRCAISSQDRINFYEPPSAVALKSEFITNPAGETTSLALRPDGAIVAFAVGVTIYLGDVETGIVHATLGKHGENVASLAFTRDGKTLLSGGYDGSVREWSAPDPK
jgi:WD40 repeat protein